jgi:hypothetical protein
MLMSNRRGSFGAMAALAGLLLLPTTAFAIAPGTLTILDREKGADNLVDGEPVVCEFAVEIDIQTDTAIEEIGWVINVYADDPWSGETVLQAQAGPTDDSGFLRQPADGWVSLPDGRYNLILDDEFPVDRSAIVRAFTVSCPAEATPTPTPMPTETTAPTPTPTPAPTETAVPTETAAPTGSAAPTESTAATQTAAPTESPQGGVGGATGTPGTTLPPTDASVSASGSGSSAVVPLVLLLIAFAAMALAPIRRPTRR